MFTFAQRAVSRPNGRPKKLYTFAQLLTALSLGYAGLAHPSDYSNHEYNLAYWACRHGKHQRRAQGRNDR